MRTWALELEGARMDEQRRKKAWVKTGDLCPFIKPMQNVRLPTCLLKSLIFPSALINGAGWVTHTRIDGDPAIRGHDLSFDKT